MLLWIIIIILFVSWGGGIGFGWHNYNHGGLLHLLVVIAVILLLYRLLTGRRPL